MREVIYGFVGLIGGALLGVVVLGGCGYLFGYFVVGRDFGYGPEGEGFIWGLAGALVGAVLFALIGLIAGVIRALRHKRLS